MFLKKLKPNEVQKALDRIANYYRNDPLFVQYANAEDAYDYYIKMYGPSIEKLIGYGMSFSYKNNYLIAFDFKEVMKQDSALIDYLFKIVPGLIPFVEREPEDVIWIFAFGPESEVIGKNGYKLLNAFINEYDNDYVILTDCMESRDVDTFKRSTSMHKILLNGEVYFRCGMEE